MSNAYCTACNVRVPWHAHRGSRLADHNCPQCGGPLRAVRGATAFVRYAQPNRARACPAKAKEPATLTTLCRACRECPHIDEKPCPGEREDTAAEEAV